MELRYPYLILVVGIVFVITLFIKRKKDTSYSTGSKIANTSYIKNTDYYKRKTKIYKIMYNIARICSFTAIILSTILLARPVNIESRNNYLYNRDIFLCMDVSASVDELNKDLVDNLKETVNMLHGERFGISIFNSSSVTVVPLTDDYEYVKSSLTQISKGIASDYNSSEGVFEYFRNKKYIISGTVEGADARGSSLIGDGLASCVYSFPDTNKDRTRIIIFSTDNDLAGTPLVDLNTAAEISKKKKVKVFGIGTSMMTEKNKEEMENAVLKTDGKFYIHGKDTIQNIVNDIEKTSKTLLKGRKETREDDVPEIPFIILVVSISLLLFLDRKVIL